MGNAERRDVTNIWIVATGICFGKSRSWGINVGVYFYVAVRCNCYISTPEYGKKYRRQLTSFAWSQVQIRRSWTGEQWRASDDSRRNASDREIEQTKREKRRRDNERSVASVRPRVVLEWSRLHKRENLLKDVDKHAGHDSRARKTQATRKRRLMLARHGAPCRYRLRPDNARCLKVANVSFAWNMSRIQTSNIFSVRW